MHHLYIAQPHINKMPTTHTLPPSLNYYCNVAHTAGDEEKAGRGEIEGSGRGREGEWRITTKPPVSCVRIAHGLVVFALGGLQREQVRKEGTHSAPLEYSLAPHEG